jgi:hypothetical protein
MERAAARCTGSMTDSEAIRQQAEVIVGSGLLGRTRSYARMLEYLVECSADGRAPKEVEIAAHVFGKGPDFDPSQDSLVRVYAHNLRQKIDHFYATTGRDEMQRITIPRGEYRIVLATREPEAAAVKTAPERRNALLGFAAAALLLLAVVLAILFLRPGSQGEPAGIEEVAASPIWSAFLDDDLPTLVVVGDYYIFGELDQNGQVERLVRDFSINSSHDLDDLFMYEPELIDKYIDLDLTYLPRASAFALRDLLRVLYTSSKPVRVISMSELNVADLKSNHIVYVGYISALDKLMEFVFASSGLTVGATYDELINKATGQIYTSGAGLPRTDQRHYRDYGLFSTFPGPGGNQIMVIAGTRDTGLMQTAYALSDPVHIGLIKDAVGMRRGEPLAFEVLYEVTGFDRTNLDAMLVYSAPLDYRTIWGGEPMQLSSGAAQR